MVFFRRLHVVWQSETNVPPIPGWADVGVRPSVPDMGVTGSVHSADAVAGDDADLRSAVQRAELRISTGARRRSCGEDEMASLSPDKRRHASAPVAHAVRAAQKYAREGKDFVVDIDITKFFYHVDHDILMGRIGAVIRDKRVLGPIGKLLRRGAMVDGVVTASVEGTPRIYIKHAVRGHRCWPTSVWTHLIRNWMSGGILTADMPTAAISGSCSGCGGRRHCRTPSCAEPVSRCHQILRP